MIIIMFLQQVSACRNIVLCRSEADRCEDCQRRAARYGHFVSGVSRRSQVAWRGPATELRGWSPASSDATTSAPRWAATFRTKERGLLAVLSAWSFVQLLCGLGQVFIARPF